MKTARYIAAAVALAVYVGICAWIVWREGSAYRDQHKKQLATLAAGEPDLAPSGLRAGTPAPIAPVAPGSGALGTTFLAPSGKTTPGLAASSQPSDRSSRPLPRDPGGRGERVSSKERSEASASPFDPIWNQEPLRKVWDLDGYTVADDQALGAQLHALILTFNGEFTGPGLRRVIEAARPLVEKRTHHEPRLTFTVLDSDIPNTFSHVGSYIYISRKLLEMIPEEDDYLLEFAIGHEIAHLELLHMLQVLRSPSLRDVKEGTIKTIYGIILPLAYPDELEFAADAWVHRKMKEHGRSDFECLSFLRKLQTYAESHNLDGGRGKLADLVRMAPEREGAISPVENHLRAHTAAFERLHELQKIRDGKK